MGDEHERDPDLLLQRLELDPQLLADLGVERAERLVEQQHRGSQDERARERDALLLAARELRGRRARQAASSTSASASSTRRRTRPWRPLRRRRPKATLSNTSRCGKQGVVLEHRVDVAPVRRHGGDVDAVEQDLAAVGRSKPAIIRSVVVLPQPEGPSSEKNSPAWIERVDPVDGDGVVEALAQTAQLGHARRAISRPPSR